jgi:hypothetical protein
MDRLLAAHPTLQAAFGDRLAQARSAYAAARTRATTGGPDGEIPAETLAALAEAQSTLETIAREACTAWVRQRLFAEPVRP